MRVNTRQHGYTKEDENTLSFRERVRVRVGIFR